MEERYYTIKETAQMLRKTERTVRRWIATGEMPAIRVQVSPVDERILVPSSEVEKYLPGRRNTTQFATSA